MTTTIAEQFGMTEALKQLGVKAINEGTSTGQNNFASGAILESLFTGRRTINRFRKNDHSSRLRKSNANCHRSFQNVSINASTTTR